MCFQVPWVPWGTHVLIGPPTAHCDLGRFCFANQDASDSQQPSCDGRCRWREALRHFGRAAGGNAALDIDKVSQGKRDAVERSDLVAAADRVVRGFCRKSRVIGLHGLECTELTVEGVNPTQQSIDNFTRLSFTMPKCLRQPN